jgi:hypothetical protein
VRLPEQNFLLRIAPLVRDSGHNCYGDRAALTVAFVTFVPNPWDTQKCQQSFNDVFNRHDAGTLAELLTEDTVFETAHPRLMGSASNNVMSKPYQRAEFVRR